MKWKRKLLPKTNNVESSENPIFIPSDLHNHDESLHISIPSDLDNHDESLHIPPPTEPCEITVQVVRSHVSGRSQLLNSSCDSPVEVTCHLSTSGRGSASGYLKRKSPVSTSCDAFSRYSELCGRNVLAKRSLDVPPATISSNFGAVEQLDLEVFEKYSDMCGKNTVTRFSTPSMNVVRTANVINSQTIFSEPLRLNVSEEVVLSHDRAHLNVAAGEVSNLSRVGGTVLNVPKKRQRNIPSVESPSKRVLQTAPRVRNRRTTTVMRDDEEGCSSGQGRGRSYAYADLGDCDQQCHHCGAAFWFGERLKGHSNYRRPQYHLCCAGGQIYMEPDPDPPEYFKNLLQNKHFMENIRAYNQMFAMTSFGAKVDDSINRGRGPYVFKVSGQIYHWIGSLCPPPGESPRFLQLYIYDTDHEVENRMRHFGGIDDSDLDPEIVEGLIQFLDAHNQLVQLFRTARDKCRQIHVPEFKIRLYNAEGARGYELPTSNTLGAVVFDSGVTGSTDFDVIIQEKAGPPKRINKLHKSYMSLQFPLLFVYGQAGFHTELKLRAANGSRNERRLTMLSYYAYQLHPRVKEYNLIFRAGRLFQQYVVGVFCSIEQNRLDFIRKKQKDIRSDHLSGLYDAISRGERDGYEVGGRIILPMSFTGGPRYMYAHYLDALAICRKLGNPQFFITFTCNVNWPEIKRYMADYPYLTPSDRADVICRVFEQKIQALLAFLKTEKTFGDVTGESKIKEAQDVDRFVSVELPDPEVDPEGYRVVSEMMMHGPCGAAKMSAPCMKGDKCSKNFPKKYTSHTFFDDKGHVHYKRRDTSISTTKHQFGLDNNYVVPYNQDLLLAFEAHINVEYCGWSMLIKYLFKYISKGTDRIFARVSKPLGNGYSRKEQKESQKQAIPSME
ncbi:DNA helicase [Tanacetum coccineum]|uniref:DNA helicase n=1 Tax=Tanacetum coccineum TaxID=301880 RepID=A0ABQ5FTP9_9ASTR